MQERAIKVTGSPSELDDQVLDQVHGGDKKSPPKPPPPPPSKDLENEDKLGNFEIQG